MARLTLRIGALLLAWALAAPAWADVPAPGAAPPAPADDAARAAARFDALPVVRLMAEAVRPREANERELRAMVAAAVRIYSAGSTGVAGDGILPAAMPTDTTYLVAAMIAQAELMARDSMTPAERATMARLAAALVCGLQRAGTLWGPMLAAERAGGHQQPFIKERGDALAASLPALIEVAQELARVHGHAVLAAVPSHTGTLRALGELELSAERWDEAAALLGRFVEREPDAQEARLSLGFALVAGGHDQEGKDVLDEAARRDRRLSSSGGALARRAMLVGAHARGVDDIAGGPVSDALDAVRAIAGAGLLNGAVAVSGALLQRHPDDPSVVATAGGLLLAAGRMGDWFALAMREPLRGAATPELADTLAAGRIQALLQAASSPATSTADLEKATEAARAAVGRVQGPTLRDRELLTLMVDALPAVARARATGGDGAAAGRAEAARIVREHGNLGEAHRLAAILLLGAGDAAEAVEVARHDLAEGGVDAAMDVAELELHAGGRGADLAALERALALAEGAEARLEVETPSPRAQAQRARALTLRAQAEAALSLLGPDAEHGQGAARAVAAAREAIPLLDLTDPRDREADLALHLLIARGAFGAGDMEAARLAVERARLDDPAAPDVELYAAILAVLDRDWVAARDLLERALLLMPNTRLELAIRKWRLFVADQLADRRGFVNQLQALDALWDEAVPPGLPAEVETLIISGATQLQATWDVEEGLVPRVGLTQRLTVVPVQRQLTREVVRSLVKQLPGGANGTDAPSGGTDD